MRLLYKCIICVHSFSILCGLSGFYNGQLWSDINIDSKLSNIGYIPILSFEKKNIDNKLLDFEFSRKFIYDFHTKNFLNDNYRSWIRYSDDNIDARLGLQKISFGNAIILRPLNWFDSIDFRSTTGHTDGLNALRLQLFPNITQSIWLWCVDEGDISCGGRFEFFNNYGNFGFTYHYDTNNDNHALFKVPQIIANLAFEGPGKNNRIGFDYRYDGNIGMWLDGSILSFNDIDDSNIRITTLGGDYTIPIYNGLLLMSETMNLSIKSENEYKLNHNTTVFMASTPIGLLNDFMFISIIDWKSKDKFNFMRWSTNFDYLSLSCMFSVNPNPLEDSFKIMLIYNH